MAKPIFELLKACVEADASDLHITTYIPPRIRIHGVLKDVEHPALTPSETKEIIYSIMTDKQKRLDDLHRGGGVAVEVGRGQGQRLAGVGDLDPGRAARRRLGPGRQHGRGAVGLGLGDEIHAVLGRAAQGREEEAGPDRLGIVGDARDLRVPRRAAGDEGDVPEDVLQLHGVLPMGPAAATTLAGTSRSGGTRR